MNEIKPISITVQSTDRSYSKLYNDLEKLNFKALHHKYPTINYGNKESTTTSKTPGKWTLCKAIQGHESDDINDQYSLFQHSMKWVLICGQCVGMNPVSGILEKEVSNIKFKYFSWRFLYGALLCFFQITASILCLFKLYRTFVSVRLLALLSFYSAIGINTFSFIRIGKKWPALLLSMYKTNLDEYIDLNLKVKCTAAMGIMLILAIVEHILSLISNMIRGLHCQDEPYNFYRAYLEHSFSWLFEIGIPFSLPLGIVMQIINLICIISWSYSDFFIVCIGFYLTSILEKINTKVTSSRDKCMPPAFWKQLREDYTQAGRLVRNFDNAINGVIFTSYANNLFFICLQMFNVLSHRYKEKPSAAPCPNLPSGPFGGYENVIYFTYSLSFVLGRFLAVSLITSGIHTASNEPASALYDIPSTMYCSEVQRFIEQVHGDTLALSGLQFFYVTKSLVLTVASTIVTYELVLLQFNGEEMVHKN
ncbi:gustatory receptor for sugar taste 64b-like isoform X1 [Galleria mellonella]|uniref:Gustatory receptor for sugar taste 64b-like isoform X1 n=1 Tax=Galleria mellonella TaxID=7137 RepID=A0A6J1X554_GALME|nr:gustatory receptor for sugar taste 64b-like isoform X1 [Galleria mellonella]